MSRYNVEYVPTVLSQEDYEAIVGDNDTDEEDNTNGNSDGTFTPGTGVCDGTGPNA